MKIVTNTIFFVMESGEIKSRSPWNSWGFQAVKCISFCPGGTSYFSAPLPVCLSLWKTLTLVMPPLRLSRNTITSDPFFNARTIDPSFTELWYKGSTLMSEGIRSYVMRGWTTSNATLVVVHSGIAALKAFQQVHRV